MRSRSAFGRMTEDRRAGEAAASNRITDVPGVVDAGAEQEPRPPLATVGDDLVDRRLGDRIPIDRGLELAGDELAAAGGNT